MRNNVLNMVIMRSFLLQGCWNFERMQNLGFCYALMPALSKIYGKGEELRKALQRHLEFFNTHPFMAAPILGAVVRMEEDLKNGLLEEGEVSNVVDTIERQYPFWQHIGLMLPTRIQDAYEKSTGTYHAAEVVPPP